MNLTSLITVDYENIANWTLGENKPNTKPIKANLLDAQINVNKVLTKDYENKPPLRPPAKQTQSNPIKPNFKSEGRREKWNVSRCSSDLYYRIMQKSRAQIYNELLVLKCQQGSRDAFEELVERWQKRLWHYAYQLTGSESAAWDIVQESWVGVIKGIRKLGDAAVFPRWAFRILNNKCADWLRKQHLQSRLSDQLANQAQDESDKRQNSDEKTESLQAAIEKLAPDRRALLTLRYSEGFDIGQIAEILDVAEGTVKSRLHRTLEKLRQVMGQK
jgi:RNA polymerase sigma-70 factor (ECF subfamily)